MSDGIESPPASAQAPRRPGAAKVAAGRMGALVTSVMDLHVRIALQEVDREKRRLISGALLISGGLTLLLLSLIAAEVALLIWFHGSLAWSWIQAALVLSAINLVVAGFSLRIGGWLTRGPYLPETTAGISKTTKALLGR
ncbi:phage holin family protein [Cyanobium sp. WAJ14-Wanaka]|uniref:phage holin family protein n=1 Tax=Cyanobium sp. WAJ14-Wanaka TaxID=2823725 RepID=UPI0029EBBDB0|nr:phage holin family protein [Cyanobium sp. WAJ14-Wanaka]